MTASQQKRVLSVRLPETLLRRVKSRAAAEGRTLQEAVQAAVEAWVGQRSAQAAAPADWLQEMERFRGSLAGMGDINVERRRDKEQEWRQDRQSGWAKRVGTASK